MGSEQRSYTYSELIQTFFPNGVIGRMHKSLCEEWGATQPWQSHSSTDPEHRKAGFVEVAKVAFSAGWDMQRWLKSFYGLEGYTVEESDSTREGSFTVVSPQQERFFVFIHEYDRTVSVTVFQPSFLNT